MKGYAVGVMLLRFAVDMLLILGAYRMSGYPPDWARAVMGAAIGGLYGGACLLPEFSALAGPLGVAMVLALVCVVVFGVQKGALRRSVLYVFLQLALNGIGIGADRGGLWSVAGSAVGILLLCLIGFRRETVATALIPVELTRGSQSVRFMALRDTGNMLRDPVTGESVLVINADVAMRLTGLSKEQIQRPVEAISSGKITGLRLIPFRSVGKNDGMMLALRFQDARIGRWKGSPLVAFAPEGLDGEYQALTGGAA